MKPTDANFAAGLRALRPQLIGRDRRVVDRFLKAGPYRLALAHQRVMRKLRREVPYGAVDWTKIVDWLKANWQDILKILLSLLVMFI